MLAGKRILLIVGDALPAAAAPEVLRHLRSAGAEVTPVLAPGAESYATPLALGSLAGREVLRSAAGQAGDLILSVAATSAALSLVAEGALPCVVVPGPGDAPADLTKLRAQGALIVGAEGAEPPALVGLCARALAQAAAEGALAGRHVIVTSGPTHEPIDPVRYIANRSSGAQGRAIAQALVALGADVTFVTGPAQLPAPDGVRLVAVETACQMRDAVDAALPADAAIFAAAVADWRVANVSISKMKKDGSGRPPALTFTENPDILAGVAQMGKGRPRLVIGFAAETDDVLAHASAKRLRKGCDWILANDVSPATGIMGGTENAVTLITASGAESWPRMGKEEVAARLAARIAEALR